MSVTRRTFLAASAAASIASAAKKKTEVSNPPNILLVLADDLASWMLGCYGNKEIKTPNMDALASRGVRFSNSLVCTPVCSPSRATLFTGRTPMQHGINDYLTDEPIADPPQGQKSVPASFANEILLTDLLSRKGYDVGYVGKWHMGDGRSPGHGVRWSYTMEGGQTTYQSPTMFLNGQPVSDQGYLAEILTRRAGEFLDQQKPGGKPFFLTVGHLNPHTPYDGHPQKYYDMYANTSFDTVGWLPAAANALGAKNMLKDTVANIRRCAASITALDDQLPALFAKLKERGLEDNTMIVLTGDNGYMTGQHGLWSKGHASDPINMYEEVLQVPMIFAWPGHTPVQTARPEMVSYYDFLPTVCEAVGVEVPDRNLCGRSYLPLITGKPLPKKHPWPTTAFGTFLNTDMARNTRFKLVLRNAGKGPNELFDLKADPHEKVNQYSNPGFVSVREPLKKSLTAWKSRYTV